MTTQQRQPKTPKTADADESGVGNEGRFETDISETGEDGTSVRQAEVKEKDLSEVKPSQQKGGQ
ncbi:MULTISPECIES: hypothetical protein [Paraburkholderia]|uniref:hypothetical protein n=1 Tax=Paraburkholderia TaxID=1822464 RepID=UPI00037E9982|nr:MULTISPECIES: hypothetical protein [Paraburkholderia]MDH6146947.1 hypothetical protein [Paraburkholderia sp. WSM4179]